MDGIKSLRANKAVACGWTFSRVAFMSFGRKWTGHPHLTPHLLSFCPRTDCWWCSLRTGCRVEVSLRRRTALISAGPPSNPNPLGHVSFWGFPVCDGVWTREKHGACSFDCGELDCVLVQIPAHPSEAGALQAWTLAWATENESIFLLNHLCFISIQHPTASILKRNPTWPVFLKVKVIGNIIARPAFALAPVVVHISR